MTFTKVLLIMAGFILLALGIAGIILPVLPATPFLLAASLCFLKSSSRLYRWIMANRFFGPRIERIRGTGLTAKEKIAIYLCACALITPVIILTHSLHLRIFLLLLLAVKAVVFLRMKTAPPPCRSSTNPPPAIPQEIQKGSSVDSKKAGANTLNRPV